MRTTFSEKFTSQQKIQEEVSKKWGYAVKSLGSSQISWVSKKAVKINTNIKPLIMDTKTPMMSSKHESLIKQIAELDHQKLMRRKAQTKNQVQFNVRKLMNERVRQYNYLIQHKHIRDKSSEESKKILKLKPKSEAELIADQIKIKNQQLMTAQDMNSQFQLNKTITQLYRCYKDKMFEDRKQSDKASQTLTVFSSPKVRRVSIGSGRQRNNSECLTQLKMRGDKKEKAENTEESEQLNINEPYINEEEIKKNNDFTMKIENNRQFMEMYRKKISTIQDFNKPRVVIKPTSGKRAAEQKIKVIIHEQLKRPTSRPEPDQKYIEILKQKRNNQIKHFSSFLERRNRKFKKPWGNKILIKYDSKIQAKQMLEGSFDGQSPNKSQFHTLNQSKVQIRSKSFYSALNEIQEESDRIIYENMKAERDDPQLYETMCKNEKINLFLKATKRNKF